MGTNNGTILWRADRIMKGFLGIVTALLLAMVLGYASANTFVIPSGVKVIEEEAFYGDKSIDEVMLQEGLERIESKAFANSSLKTISFPKSVKYISDDVFQKTSVSKVNAAVNTFAYEWAVGKGYIISGITIQKSKEVIKAGEFISLSATVYPRNALDPSVSWTSSNTSVATVNGSGQVTGKKAGTVVITVASQKYVDVKATYKIVVEEAIPVSEVNISNSSLKLRTGEQATLKAEVLPATADNQTITWTSSNTKVATVSGGKVTSVAAGSATITAKSANGKTAVCAVTVEEYVPISEFSLKRDEADIYMGTAYTIRPRIFPANATNQNIIWTVDDESICTVKDGVVTPQKLGETTIHAQVENEDFSADFLAYVCLNRPEVKIDAIGGGVAYGKFSWEKVPGAVSYNVYWMQNSDDDPIFLGNTKNLNYTVSVSKYTDRTAEWYLYVCPVGPNGEEYKGDFVDVDYWGGGHNYVKLTADKVTTNSITVSWREANYVSYYCIYCYLYDNGYSDSSKVATVYPGDDSSYTITGLKANTKYGVEIRAFAYNNKTIFGRTDTSVSSDTKVAKTTLSAGNTVTSFTLSQTGTLNMAAGTSKSISFSYSPSTTEYDPQPKWTSSNTSVVKVNTWSGKMTALKAGTATITATTTDSSNISKSFTVNVTGSAAVGEVTNVHQTAATNTSVSFAWTAAANATEYVIYYTEGSSSSYVEHGTVTEPSCTITGLKAATDYGIYILPRNSSQKGTITNYCLMSTVDGSQYLATPVAYVQMGKASAVLSWDVVNTALGYKVYYGTSATIPSKEYTTLGSTQHSITIPSLTENTSYYFWVKAYNMNAERVSSAVQGYTDSYSLSAVLNGSTINITANDTWTATADSWIHLSESGGSGSENITFTLDSNTGAASRTGTVILVCGTVTRSVQITQEAVLSVQEVRLSTSKLDNLYVGGTAVLEAFVMPETAADRTVTWESSDKSVATVENGTVRALKAGNATITVTTNDGKKKATCAVVVKTSTVKAETIYMTKDGKQITEVNSYGTMMLELGKGVTLSAVVGPNTATNKAVIWEVNDGNVVTVNNGTIRAVGGGNATVRVKTADSTDDNMIAAYLVITVPSELTVTDLFTGENVVNGTCILPKYVKVNDKRTLSIHSNISWTLNKKKDESGTPSNWLSWSKQKGDTGDTELTLTVMKVPASGTTYSTTYIFTTSAGEKFELKVELASHSYEYDLYKVDNNGYAEDVTGKYLNSGTALRFGTNKTYELILYGNSEACITFDGVTENNWISYKYGREGSGIKLMIQEIKEPTTNAYAKFTMWKDSIHQRQYGTIYIIP